MGAGAGEARSGSSMMHSRDGAKTLIRTTLAVPPPWLKLGLSPVTRNGRFPPNSEVGKVRLLAGTHLWRVGVTGFGGGRSIRLPHAGGSAWKPRISFAVNGKGQHRPSGEVRKVRFAEPKRGPAVIVAGRRQACRGVVSSAPRADIGSTPTIGHSKALGSVLNFGPVESRVSKRA
jgi:hypothetical protein